MLETEAGEGPRGQVKASLLSRVKKFRISWASPGLLPSAGIHGRTLAFGKTSVASVWRTGGHRDRELKKIREAVAVV